MAGRYWSICSRLAKNAVPPTTNLQAFWVGRRGDFWPDYAAYRLRRMPLEPGGVNPSLGVA